MKFACSISLPPLHKEKKKKGERSRVKGEEENHHRSNKVKPGYFSLAATARKP